MTRRQQILAKIRSITNNLMDIAKRLQLTVSFPVIRLDDTAGVSRCAIYWHFKSKLEVFLVLINYILDVFSNDFDEIVGKQISPLEKIRMTIIYFNNRFIEDEVHRALGFLYHSIEWTPELRDGLNQIVQKLENRFTDSMNSIIRAGQKTGEISNSIDSGIIYLALKHFLKGMAFSVFDHNKPLLKKEIPDLANIFIDGICAPLP